MSASSFDVVVLKKEVNLIYLLWESRESHPDHYLTFSNSKDLILGETLDELASAMSREGLIFSPKYPFVEFDMKEFWGTLRDLPHQKKFPEEFCGLLIDFWNLMDDISYSIGVNAIINNNKIIENIYENIFFGNNLPALRSGGEVYAPVFSKKELLALGDFLSAKWIELEESCQLLKKVGPSH